MIDGGLRAASAEADVPARARGAVRWSIDHWPLNG